MRIAFASDHAALELRAALMGFVVGLGHEAVDLGTDSAESCDYPDFARAGAEALQSGRVERAILICGTGQGMAMTANRFDGVRCCACSDVYSARMSRAHNDANALALGARVVAVGLACEIVEVWLRSDFEGGRHSRRVAKITAG
jgi:ribose 5-phosphate isomerase B